MMRLGTSVLAALTLTLAMAAPARASAILVGNTITFNLVDAGIVPDQSDTKLISAAGQGIFEGDGSNIGSQAMLDGEFIKVFDTSIVFSLQGGSGTLVGPDHQTTGYGAGARYVLTGLFDPAVAEIAGVSSIVLSNVINVALGTQVLFDTHSLTLFIDDLGILTSGTNLGTITVNFNVREFQDPTPNPEPVPEPATLTLLGSGLAAAWMRRRNANRQIPLS